MPKSFLGFTSEPDPGSKFQRRERSWKSGDEGADKASMTLVDRQPCWSHFGTPKLPSLVICSRSTSLLCIPCPFDSWCTRFILGGWVGLEWLVDVHFISRATIKSAALALALRPTAGVGCWRAWPEAPTTLGPAEIDQVISKLKAKLPRTEVLRNMDFSHFAHFWGLKRLLGLAQSQVWCAPCEMACWKWETSKTHGSCLICLKLFVGFRGSLVRYWLDVSSLGKWQVPVCQGCGKFYCFSGRLHLSPEIWEPSAFASEMGRWYVCGVLSCTAFLSFQARKFLFPLSWFLFFVNFSCSFPTYPKPCGQRRMIDQAQAAECLCIVNIVFVFLSMQLPGRLFV